MTRCLSLVAVAVGGAAVADALVQNGPHDRGVRALKMSAQIGVEEDLTPVATRRGPGLSEAIPFLARPKVLTGELAGDVGFDPLGFAQDRDQLWQLREAEVKHARLAMLAAAGWSISELVDRDIADYFGVPSVLDASDRAPSMFNGGMDKISPVWWGFCLGLTASIDVYGVARARAAGPDSDYVPGDLGFDTLSLYPSDNEGKKRMQLAEIKHGRLEMVAVTGFAIQEAITQSGVVDETPIFFHPITETASQMLGVVETLLEAMNIILA